MESARLKQEGEFTPQHRINQDNRKRSRELVNCRFCSWCTLRCILVCESGQGGCGCHRLLVAAEVTIRLNILWARTQEQLRVMQTALRSRTDALCNDRFHHFLQA